MHYKCLKELESEGLTKGQIKKMARRGILVEGFLTGDNGQKIRVYTTTKEYEKFLEEERAANAGDAPAAPLPPEGATSA